MQQSRKRDSCMKQPHRVRRKEIPSFARSITSITSRLCGRSGDVSLSEAARAIISITSAIKTFRVRVLEAVPPTASAGNKVFVTCQTQGGRLTPTPLRMQLMVALFGLLQIAAVTSEVTIVLISRTGRNHSHVSVMKCFRKRILRPIAIRSLSDLWQTSVCAVYLLISVRNFCRKFVATGLSMHRSCKQSIRIDESCQMRIEHPPSRTPVMKLQSQTLWLLFQQFQNRWTIVGISETKNISSINSSWSASLKRCGNFGCCKIRI